MSTIRPVKEANPHTPPNDATNITHHTHHAHPHSISHSADNNPNPSTSHALPMQPTPYDNNSISPPICSTPTTPPTPTPTPNPTHSSGYTQLPLPDLPPTNIRLISHNINTLHTTTPAELGAILDSYAQYQPTIIGLQETNKNWTLYDKTEGPLRTLVNRRWHGAKIVTAHCKDEVFKSPHQPGGVAQLLLNKLTGRTIDHGRDDLGRYAWQMILLDGKRNLVLITAYRVTQDNVSNCGYTTSAMQQWRKLKSAGYDAPNPRQQLLTDLGSFAKTHILKGNEVIIMIDANSSGSDKTIEHFLDDVGLFDLMNDYLPDQQPSTYQRGRSKIDHIWGTPGVLTATIHAGVLPFGTGPNSDHAPIYLDFSFDLLTGLPTQSLYDPTHPGFRNLWSTDVKAAEKYIQIVQQGFIAENIHERVAILVSRCQRTDKCTADDERILNKIDESITQIMLRAEVECKKARGYAWSPLLANAGRTVIAAKWHLSAVLNGRLQIRLMDRAQAIINAKKQLKEAYATLRKVQKNAKQIRDSFLMDRAEHLAHTSNIQKAAAVQQLLRAERQAITFRKLGSWLKENEYTQLTRVLIPDDPTDIANTTWKTVVEAQELYDILTKEGQTHYRQAADTPLVNGPFAELIGPFDDNECCDAILNGTFDMSAVDAMPEVRDIIAGMRYPKLNQPTPPINTTITDDEFFQMIFHTRERTSSSPSGRHYGHYRTLLRDPTLLGCIASIANFCFHWGVSLRRWEKAIQPLIPKDPGVPRIHRMRRIVLIEGDLNICLSELFSRRLMLNAEQYGILHKGQYGSRQGKMAISMVLLKRLSYDIIRQARMDACMFDNDATACYDRIIPSMAMVKCRRAGLPRPAAKVVLHFLQRTKYHVRTAYGISADAFSNFIDYVLGLIQGTGHAGPGWAMTSSIMFDQLDNTHGAHFHSPRTNRMCRRTGEAFVDDSSLWLLKLGLTLNIIIGYMQDTAQKWERLLYATGGALNHAKCFWYGIKWIFNKNGGCKMENNPTNDDPEITLTAGGDLNTRYKIQRMATHKGVRTLGVRLAPDGNDCDEYQYRIQQANTIKQRLSKAPIGREHTRIGFQSIWRAMIQYPLGATCFTSKQCQKIQAKYMPTFLSRMGINRATATALRHGPLHLGGFDIFNLETEQGVMKTKMVLSHLRRNDEVGQMLNVSRDHLQLQAGVPWPVMSRHGTQQRKYVDPCYLTHLWDFLDSTDTHLQFDSDQWLRPQRIGDRFIMDELSNLPGITTKELVAAQRCRLYLGATTLADICTSQGNYICEWANNGCERPRTPAFQFPQQSCPATHIWKIWQRLIRLCYCTGTSMKLNNTLGPWIKGQIRQVWNTAIDPRNSKIYIWNDGYVRIYERQGRSKKQYRYLRPHTSKSFPMGCVPVSGSFQAGTFVIHGYASINSPILTTANSVHDQSIMHRGTHHTASPMMIAQAIWDGQAILATDGSVRHDSATYAWIISTTNDTIGQDVASGGLLPPSAPLTHHASKRPEAAALYAALTWINELLTQHPDHTSNAGTTPALPIPVDNQSVIDDIIRPVTNLSPTFMMLTPDFDIIQAIRRMIKKLPIPVDIFHVQAHQDRDKPYDELDPFAQINILADKYANQLHQCSPSSIGLFPSWVPGTTVALFHGSSQVTSHIPKYLRQAAHEPPMRAYLIERSHTATGRDSKWTDTIYDNIAWKQLGEALRRQSIGQRIQLSKFMHDLLPTAKRLQTFDNKHDGRCFACQQLWEDTNHVLNCPSDDREQARTQAFTILRQHFQKQHTPNVLTDLICDSMNNWIQRRRIVPPQENNPDEPIMQAITIAFHSQKRIGWDQFFRGRLSTDWNKAIDIYYRDRRPGNAYTPEQWMRTTINAIWTFSMTLWRQRCTSYHGSNGIITLERQRKDTALQATEIYQKTIGTVNPMENIILHRHSVNNLLNWTKQHLDAYLATAEVICEWNVEPG